MPNNIEEDIKIVEQFCERATKGYRNINGKLELVKPAYVKAIETVLQALQNSVSKDKIKEQIEWLENDIKKTKVSTKIEKEPCLIYDDFRKVRLRAFNTKSKEIIRRLGKLLK